MLVKDVLAEAGEQLRTVSDSPRLDAELLLGRASGWSRARLVVEQGTELAPEAQQAFGQLLERRIHGEPVAYILGEKEFWSLPLAVSPAVLVPRPDTEALVERALLLIEGLAKPRLFDLGTGSGAIALALAVERPDARVLATDKSAEALSIAEKNAQRLGVRNLDWRCGDWFEAVEGERAELIASNPPYIAASDPHLASLQAEPRIALVAEEDGLACLRRLVDGAPEHLVPGGWLVLEHGWQQGAQVRELLSTRGFSGVASDKDYGGNERVSFGQWHG